MPKNREEVMVVSVRMAFSRADRKLCVVCGGGLLRRFAGMKSCTPSEIGQRHSFVKEQAKNCPHSHHTNHRGKRYYIQRRGIRVCSQVGKCCGKPHIIVRVGRKRGEARTQRERCRGSSGQGCLHSPHTEGTRPSITQTDRTCVFLDTTVLVSLHQPGIAHASLAMVRVQGRTLIRDVAFTYTDLSASAMPRWRMACSLLSSVCATSVRCLARTGHNEGALSVGNPRDNTLGYLGRSYPYPRKAC
jgi:hypothetical protein